MLLSDIWELYKDDPSLLPLGFLGMFGVGLQTYAPPEAYVKLNEIRNAPDPEKAWNDLQAIDKKLAQKVERAGIESSFNEFDWSLTYMGVENGDRAKFLFEYLKKLSTDERMSLYQELQGKKLISKNVDEQIKFLFENKSETSNFTTRETEGFRFPDYPVYSGEVKDNGSRNIRADLSISNDTDNIKDYKIEMVLISPSGKEEKIPQGSEKLNPGENLNYGLEAPYPKNPEKGHWNINIFVNGKQIITKDNAFEIR